MLRSTITLLFAACVTIAGWPVLAFEQLPVELPPAQPQMIKGAKAVSPEDWPATLIFLTEDSGCTSTLVGNRVVLTAAHCIGNGESGAVTVGGRRVEVTCDHHTEYRKGHADFALCLLAGEVSNVPFELISSALAYARLKDAVTLSGYGCLTVGGRDRKFGVLHVGTATVTAVPSGTDFNTETTGGAALCFGDSGGAGYFQLANGVRVIVGVNSQGDADTISRLATTATPLFVNWAMTWAAGHGVRICGLHPDATGCRS